LSSICKEKNLPFQTQKAASALIFEACLPFMPPKPKKFELVFSFYTHPLFGMLAEPFLVQLLENGQLSLTYQKVAEVNAEAFLPDVSRHQVKLISILRRLSNQFLAKELQTPTAQLETQLKKLSEAKDEKGRKLFEYLKGKIQSAKEEFFQAIDGSEKLFESGKDGYPAHKPLEFLPAVKLQMRYFFSPEGIHAEPCFDDVRLNGQPVQLLDEVTPFGIAGNFLFPVPAGMKPSRLKPFALKRAIEIQPSFMAEFSQKIILPDLTSGLAVLEGNAATEEFPLESAEVFFSFKFVGEQLGLYEQGKQSKLHLPDNLVIKLSWFYGKWKTQDLKAESSTWVFEDGEKPVFRLLKRDRNAETERRNHVQELLDVKFNNGECIISFEHLRDAVLDKLDRLPSGIRYRFSPEFAQISLKKVSLRYQVFDKINYFEIEGKIDWADGEMDFIALKSGFVMENGWLKAGDQYLPIDESDKVFLEQLMALSEGNEKLKLPRSTAQALKQSNENMFSDRWDKITSLLSSTETLSKADASVCSPHFALREYQQKGLNWFVQLSGGKFGGILADDMGLGKTFQAAAFLRYLRESGEKACALVVVPSTLLFNWKQELSRFSPDYRVCIHHGANRAQDLKTIFSCFEVILVSYQTLLRDVTLFAGLPFGALIADEAQHLKNPSTGAWQAVKSLEAKNVFLLTGTPLQNSPADLWALSELCNPGLLNKKIKPAGLQKNENPIRFRRNLELLQALTRPFMLRRTKESVLSELPEKTVSVVLCGMGEEQELEYLACNQLLSSQISDLAMQRSKGHNVRILKALTTLRQMANHPAMLDAEYSGRSGKFELVKEKLAEVLEEGRKVLIFSSFVRHLQLMENYLQAEKLPYALLTGQTNDRKAQVERFQQDPACKIFLISLKAGGFGLNLVEASCVFLLDPWWNPAAELQAMDRVHRIGQKDRVTVYKFITANTVEEKILKLQEQKSAMNAQLFDESGETETSGPLSIELLQSILMTKV
jgi:SNF2 family DNA or RNA helicase